MQKEFEMEMQILIIKKNFFLQHLLYNYAVVI